MKVADTDTLRYEKRDRKCFLTLNRPESMNALNRALLNGIDDAIADFMDDDDLHVMIVAGEGGRAFSAGADLKDAAARSPHSSRGGEGSNFLSRLESCTKPVIAAIDGYALAGGFEMALLCDIRIATEQSQFGLPEPRRSLMAGPGLHNLSRMIPLGEALNLQLTGGRIGASRAYQIGLIQYLVSDRTALMARTDTVANEILQCAPLAVQAIKEVVKVGRNLPVEYSKRFARPLEERVYNSEDHGEGPRAFVEKRDPIWKGR